MPQTRAQFPDLFDLSIRAENYLADQYLIESPKAEVLFDVQTSELKEEKISGVGGYEELDVTAEGQSWAGGELVELYDKTITPLQYSKEISITRLARMDDPKALLKFETAVRAHTAAAIHKSEKLAASIFNNGFTSSVLSPDGQFLFDTDHPQSPANTATTYSNVIDVQLDENGSALQAMFLKMGDNAFDAAGHPITFPGFYLVVPTALKNKALKSVTAIYGNSATTAPTPVQSGQLYGAEIEVVHWRYLDAANGGSDTAWFLIAKKEFFRGSHSLRWYWRERPTFNTEGVAPYIEQSNGNYNFPIVMRCAGGAIDWRHCWGSTGTV